jgi:transposase
MSNIPRPVYIAGVRYESVTDACRLAPNPRTGKPGIKRQLVHRSVKAGRSGWYYEDAGQEVSTSTGRRGAPGRAVVVDGKSFPNVHAAAEAVGIGRQALLRRIENGIPGTYFADEGQRPDIRPAAKVAKAAPGKRGARSIPFVLDGVRYESLAAAAKSLGKSIGYVRNALARAKAAAEGTGTAPGGRGKRGTPIIVNGKQYRSFTEAAKALGVELSTISRAAKRERERLARVAGGQEA